MTYVKCCNWGLTYLKMTTHFIRLHTLFCQCSDYKFMYLAQHSTGKNNIYDHSCAKLTKQSEGLKLTSQVDHVKRPPLFHHHLAAWFVPIALLAATHANKFLKLLWLKLCKILGCNSEGDNGWDIKLIWQNY